MDHNLSVPRFVHLLEPELWPTVPITALKVRLDQYSHLNELTPAAEAAISRIVLLGQRFDRWPGLNVRGYLHWLTTADPNLVGRLHQPRPGMGLSRNLRHDAYISRGFQLLVSAGYAGYRVPEPDARPGLRFLYLLPEKASSLLEALRDRNPVSAHAG